MLKQRILTVLVLAPIAIAGVLLLETKLFALVLGIVFGFGLTYLVKMIRRGPVPFEPPPQTEGGEHTPARPLSAADESLEER